jgi:hypothetical protein
MTRMAVLRSRMSNSWQCWFAWMMRSTKTSAAVGFLKWASVHAVDQSSRSLGASKKLKRGFKSSFVSIGYVPHRIQDTARLKMLCEVMHGGQSH